MNDRSKESGGFCIAQAIDVESERTDDFRTSKGIIEIPEREGSGDEPIAFPEDRNPSAAEIEAGMIADKLLRKKPLQGYITMSNALPWRWPFAGAEFPTEAFEGIRKLA